ncbi:DUF4430 domain-containing protein [Okeania sp. SIO2B3]|uniref:DUF4430 domain-containing protein n=1 Tax=Okeania sp. SIO2B3 TaxID=2607784 RepID=UPI0013C28510|nr:DUF4430 domain-containing protein [Okeania sp. SIO2B3]NET44231.1 DUF4430 domain-containing protein [Okeania sp. SIO2B3]
MTVAMLAFNLFLQPSATAESELSAKAISQCPPASKTVSINVELNGEKIYDIQNVPWIENETVSLAMKNAKFVDSTFTYETNTSSPFGDLVTTIGGNGPGFKKYWQLRINDKPSLRGIDTAILPTCDQIEWKNESF